jgi:hypothetical protein
MLSSARSPTVAVVSETRLIGHQLIEPCYRCDGTASGIVTEAIDGDRVVWSTVLRCNGCGHTIETSEPATKIDTVRRRALIARVGLVRLQADPTTSRPLRRRLLALFRKNGAAIGETAEAYARLTGAGLSGTPAEMQLLANQLATEGATVTLKPYVGDG